MYIITTNIKTISFHGKSFILCIKYKIFFPKIRKSLSSMWRKRSIPTHSEWLYPLTFDAGKGLKEA